MSVSNLQYFYNLDFKLLFFKLVDENIAACYRRLDIETSKGAFAGFVCSERVVSVGSGN